MKKKKSIYNSLQEWANAFPQFYTNAIREGTIKRLCERFGWEVPIEFEDIKVGDTICIEPTSTIFNRISKNKKIKDFIVFTSKKTFHLPAELKKHWRLYRRHFGLHFKMSYFKTVLTEKVNKKFRKRRKKLK